MIVHGGSMLIDLKLVFAMRKLPLFPLALTKVPETMFNGLAGISVWAICMCG